MGNETKDDPSSGWTKRNLSDDQITRIVEKANANPKLWDLRDIAQLLADTGLRRGELAVLPWSDVNMAESRVFVQNSMSRYGGRHVPFGSRGAEALESLRQRRPGSELVLGDDANHLLRRCALQLEKLTAEIGMRHAGLHAFRRAAILRGIASGIAFDTMSRRFGFSNPAWITRLYLNPVAEANRVPRIGKKVQALFRS